MLGKLFYIILALLIALLMLLLYLANVKRLNRHKQLAYPLMAFGFALIAIVLYNELYNPLKQYALSVASQTNDLLFVNRLMQYFDIFFSLCIVLAFIIAKYFAKYSVVRFTKRYMPAYTFNHNECMPLIKEKWVFAQIFFKYGVAVALFLVIITFIALRYSWNFTPNFTIISFFVVLEVFWYLNGYSKHTYEQDEVVGENSSSTINDTYRELWNKYQEVWPGPLLAAWHFSRNSAKIDLLEQFDDPIMNFLSRKGMKFSKRELDIYSSIEQGSDVLIEASRYSNIASVLFASIYNRISRGENILFVTNSRNNSPENPYDKEIANWIQSNLIQITGLKHFAQPYCYSPSVLVPMESNIMISSVGDIVDSEIINHDWFKNMQTVVFMNVANMFDGEISLISILLGILKHRNPKLQIVSLSNTYRDGIEASIRSILPVNNRLNEYRYNNDSPNKNYALIWNSDHSTAFQSNVFSGHIAKHLGEEPVLALLASSADIGFIRLMGINSLPFEEYIEEVENNKAVLIDGIDFKGITKENLKVESMPFLKMEIEKGATFCRDCKFNLPVAMQEWNSYTEKTSLFNVVCPPYLLRGYFVSNIRYFYKVPLFNLSPSISQTRFTVAYFLVRRMIANSLSETQMIEIIKRYCNGEEVNNAIDTLKSLAKEALGINDLYPHLTVSKRLNFKHESHEFVSEVLYGLKKDILNQSSLLFHKWVNVMDSAGNILRRVQYDFLYQQFLKNQIHSFYGKPYRVGHFNLENFILNVSFATPEKITKYHQSRYVVLMDAQNALPSNVSNQNEVNDKYKIQLIESKFEVHTKGYFAFNSGVKLSGTPNFYPLRDVPVRTYPLGRMLRLQFVKQKDFNFDYNVISATLSVIVNEIFCTLFPETHNYLLCGSPHINKLFQKSNFENYFPIFKANTGVNFDEENTFSLFLIEDAHQDLGLLPSFFSKFNHILDIIDDYLQWLLYERESEPYVDEKIKIEIERLPNAFASSEKHGDNTYVEKSVNSNPINEIFWSNPKYKDSFLTYGSTDYPHFIDLKATKEYLKLIRINEINSITEQRTEFNKGKKTFIGVDDTGHYCDFCAEQINGAEYESLDDGRERCSKCKVSAINDLEKLKDVLTESKGYFKSIFNTKLPDGITIEFANAERIHQSLGKEFVPTSGFDSRAVGLAFDKTIMIENGAPYARTLSTVVHELTHIWQNYNLDTNRMKQEADLLFIEGHAVWASVKVLEFKQIAEEYRNHYNLRDDEYGVGLRKIVELLKKSKVNNAFILLKNIFPK